MNCLRGSRGAKGHPSEYATVEDFRNVFTEEMNKLHLAGVNIYVYVISFK